MKSISPVLLLLIVFSCTSFISKADTVDYWKVYYKGKELKADKNKVIRLKKVNVRQGDSITVTYFRDTDCEECKVRLTIQDQEKAIGTTGASNLKTETNLSISFFDIVQYHLKAKKKKYAVSFYDGNTIYDLYYIRIE